MNQLNFEREFDERLLYTLGELLQTLIDMPTADQHDSETIWLDTANGVLKISGA